MDLFQFINYAPDVLFLWVIGQCVECWVDNVDLLLEFRDWASFYILYVVKTNACIVSKMNVTLILKKSMSLLMFDFI